MFPNKNLAKINELNKFGIMDNCTKVPHHVDLIWYQSPNCAKNLREIFLQSFPPGPVQVIRYSVCKHANEQMFF